MAIIYDAPSTDWETETETTSAPRIIYPIAQNTSAIVYVRDYIINQDDWSPTALDTADVTYSSAYLVEETTPSQIGGTLVTYTKRFATVPNDWTDYEERAFTFPGYFEDAEAGEADYRAPYNRNATWEVIHSYVKTTDPYTDFDVSNFIFQVTDPDGVVLEYVNDDTSPTFDAYAAFVAAETFLNVAHSTLERYAGNIWVQKQFRSKAQ